MASRNLAEVAKLEEVLEMDERILTATVEAMSEENLLDKMSSRRNAAEWIAGISEGGSSGVREIEWRMLTIFDRSCSAPGRVQPFFSSHLRASETLFIGPSSPSGEIGGSERGVLPRSVFGVPVLEPRGEFFGVDLLGPKGPAMGGDGERAEEKVKRDEGARV